MKTAPFAASKQGGFYFFISPFCAASKRGRFIFKEIQYSYSDRWVRWMVITIIMQCVQQAEPKEKVQQFV